MESLLGWDPIQGLLPWPDIT
ncbi:hypothetical protein A2U01_0086294, partial [Trifolium medium]|nr:hypothetical protein [Trifolium medium]